MSTELCLTPGTSLAHSIGCYTHYARHRCTSPMVLPLLNEMGDQKSFISLFGVLNVGLVSVIFIYAVLGFMSYLKFGENIQDSVTLNIPSDKQWLFILCQVAVALGIMLTYPLQFYVAFEQIWIDIDQRYGPIKHSKFMEFLARVGIIITTLVAAALIPALGLFISLIGAVGSTALALVLPVLCDISLKCGRSRSSVDRLCLSFDVLILLVAALGALTGTYCSLVDLYEHFKKHGL